MEWPRWLKEAHVVEGHLIRSFEAGIPSSACPQSRQSPSAVHERHMLEKIQSHVQCESAKIFISVVQQQSNGFKFLMHQLLIQAHANAAAKLSGFVCRHQVSKVLHKSSA